MSALGRPPAPDSTTLISALRATQTNLIAYQLKLQDEARRLMAEGNVDQAYKMQSLADQVNIEETRVAQALLAADAAALQVDLNKLGSSDVDNLQTIVNKIDNETKNLAAAEATFKWMLGVAGALVTVLLAAGTGGLAGALVALASLLASKPTTGQ